MSANRDRLLAMVEKGVLTADELNMMLVKWCSEADLAELLDTYGYSAAEKCNSCGGVERCTCFDNYFDD